MNDFDRERDILEGKPSSYLVEIDRGNGFETRYPLESEKAKQSVIAGARSLGIEPAELAKRLDSGETVATMFIIRKIEK